jgi:hypothetical protein
VIVAKKIDLAPRESMTDKNSTQIDGTATDSDEIRGPIHSLQDVRLFWRAYEEEKAKIAEKAKKDSKEPPEQPE